MRPAGRCPVLVDIDGTLTDDRRGAQIDPRHPLGNALFRILRDELARGGRSRTAAEQALRRHTEENVFWDYPDFVEHFDLPAERVWRSFRAWHARHLKAYADGVRMVKDLRRRGHPLFIISNNPLTGCLFKLEVAGLGGLAGSSCFCRIFCSNIMRGQKGRPAYWRRAFISAGLDPATVVVVGNDRREDFEVPRELGIRHTFLVDRARARPAVPEAGLTVVGSLGEVGRLLDRLEAGRRPVRPRRCA
jgi:FMN phosphatase YigB (HAD superfamily)